MFAVAHRRGAVVRAFVAARSLFGSEDLGKERGGVGGKQWHEVSTTQGQKREEKMNPQASQTEAGSLFCGSVTL